MKKDLYQTIDIPEGIEANIEDNELTVKGPEGENKREFKVGKFEFRKEGNKIIMGGKNLTKGDKRLLNTNASHIKNMVGGLGKKFKYELKVCFSHFPITVDLQGDIAIIKNFQGEKINRSSKILDGVDVKLHGQILTVESINKELAGQTAANFEIATKIRNKDRRVFQDGIFMTSKNGVAI